MIYDLPKRIFLLKNDYELKSFSAVQSAFRVKFKVKVAPGHQIIKNIVQAFEKTGSVVPGRSKGQIPTQKRQEAKKQLETMVKEFPNLSIRKAASAVDVSKNTRVLYSA